MCSYGQKCEGVTTCFDSDWASSEETLKSSSAGVILTSSDMLKAYTRKQQIIARSSAESEVYAAALGASESKEIVSLLCDLFYEMQPVLAIDAKATEHVLHRQGIGRFKHVRLRCAESGVRRTWQISAPRRWAKQ